MRSTKTRPILFSRSHGILLAVAERGTRRIIIHGIQPTRVSLTDVAKAADLRERNRRPGNPRYKVSAGSNGSHDAFHLTQFRTAWIHHFDRVGTELDRLRSLDRRGPVFCRKTIAAGGRGTQRLSRFSDEIVRRPMQEASENFS